MKKILIIDDAADYRLILKNLLRKYDFKIIEAIDGQEGWKLIITENPDLILLDLHMPNKSGFEILKELEEEWIEIPVVVISGDINNEIIDSCLSYGVKSFIQKPVIPTELNNIIRKISA